MKILSGLIPGVYISRKVLNAKAIVQWAKSIGIKSIVDPKDMHLTVSFSRKHFDIALRERAVKVNSGNLIRIKPLGHGDSAMLVLEMKSMTLQNRFKETLAAGAEWDYDEFIPHISISTDTNQKIKELPRFDIILGPEIAEPLIEDWKPITSSSALFLNFSGSTSQSALKARIPLISVVLGVKISQEMRYNALLNQWELTISMLPYDLKRIEALIADHYRPDIGNSKIGALHFTKAGMAEYTVS